MGVVWAQTIGVNGAKAARVSRRHARLRGAPGRAESDSAALQGRIAVESGDSAPIAGFSGPVPMVWAPRAARGGLARAVYTRRAHQCERSRSRLGAPLPAPGGALKIAARIGRSADVVIELLSVSNRVDPNTLLIGDRYSKHSHNACLPFTAQPFRAWA